MVRRDAGEAVAAERPCTSKIRKRCALSPSSGASGTLRRLRLRRGVVSLRRMGSGGVASPLPTSWKMSESSWNRARRADGMHSSSSVSARKLVNALWQMNELEEEEEEEAVRRGSTTHRRCASSVEISKRSRTKNKVALDADHSRCFSDKLSNGGTMGVHACAQDSSSTCSVDRNGNRATHMQDMYNSLTACKELVRVLGNIWGPGHLNPSTASILSALRSELDHTRQLAKEQSRRGDEVELMKRRLAAEARAWKSRQREKVVATVRVVSDELDGERRSRRRAERVSTKLGKALAETERELELERRSRERLEKVCDELVRSGEAEEEIRREAEEAAHAEVVEEREMLRLADELREERVQMKLLEARLQFEEKNAVVDQLRGELEAFLETKKLGLPEESPAAVDEERQGTHDDRRASGGEGADEIGRVDASKRTDVDDEGGSDDDDSDGEMHSFELNMKDGWSYSTGSKEKEMTATTAKKAASFSASVDSRGTPECADPWAGAAFDEGGQQWDNDDEGCSDIDDDEERYQAIKNLREQMLAGHGFHFPVGSR